ncbi:uncharacterized protein RBU33_003637 isoform 1-T1 [Hipposideros larvatus]
MNGNKQEHAVDAGQNAVEMVSILPRNPYCSNERAHCVCRLPNMAFQPQWATAKPWSLWKTFLVCLLACLIATALVVLVLYFVHFGKPTTGTTIIIQADGKFRHVICIPGSTPSPASSLLPGSQGTLPSIPLASQSSPTTMPPSTPVANQSLPTTVPPSTMETTRTTTVDHEIIIEE